MRYAASILLFTLAILSVSPATLADEDGTSFWLPGQYASFAAIAPSSEWSLPMQTYYYSGNAGAGHAIIRGDQITFGLDTDFAAQFIAPTYSPDTKVFGGRPSLSLAFFPGYESTDIDSSLGSLSTRRSDALTGFGDLYPTVQLFWDCGTHNWMAYLTGDIPVGAYDPHRLSNLGLGHGAVDAGGAYTYMNTKTGWEFSATAGLTYNLENSDTDYRSGIDSHLDLGLSRSLTEHFFTGLVGYAFVQLTPDHGQPALLGDFKSRTFAIGPQVGYTFQVGSRSIFANLRGYIEFKTKNRPSGGDVYLTINIPLGRSNTIN
ncbi:SphA family protein [Microbulbifer pacificus]|uniref:SphA family protein n=1 Tax=Microbulbifer pacificus TaxID=407164 RepID=UPI000CF3BF22|nr:transporter [Microbulbifer pacificus]